jgi:hypothetical protein
MSNQYYAALYSLYVYLLLLSDPEPFLNTFSGSSQLFHRIISARPSIVYLLIPRLFTEHRSLVIEKHCGHGSHASFLSQKQAQWRSDLKRNMRQKPAA